MVGSCLGCFEDFDLFDHLSLDPNRDPLDWVAFRMAYRQVMYALHPDRRQALSGFVPSRH